MFAELLSSAKAYPAAHLANKTTSTVISGRISFEGNFKRIGPISMLVNIHPFNILIHPHICKAELYPEVDDEQSWNTYLS